MTVRRFLERGRERLRHADKAVLALLAIRFALGVVYSVAVPLWEAHDEWGHYAVMHYIAQERRLPAPGQSLGVEFDESQQPPLYYVLGALAIAAVDARDWTPPDVNPYARTGTGIGGLNMAVHTPEEAFPYRGWVLSAHLARLVSVLLATLTVWLTYRMAAVVSAGCRWLALTAAAIVAFWPQLLFVGSVITNDVLVVCCAAWVLLALVKTLDSWPPRYAHIVELALALGAVMLSKLTALGLLALFPLVILALGVKTVRRRERLGRFWALTGGMAALALGVGGWWYLRNLASVGSPVLRYQRVLKSLGLIWTDPADLAIRLKPVSLWGALRYGFLTFTASFGWGNVPAAWWVYALFAVLLGVGGVGCIGWLVRRGEPKVRHAGWLALAMVCVLAPPIYLLLYKGTELLRGRMVLAILPPLAVFVAAGIGHWLSPVWRDRLPRVLGGALAAVAVAVPFLYIAPVYAPPPVIPAEQVVNLPNPVYVRFGDQMELLGYEYGNRGRYAPGDVLEIRVYWRGLVQMERNYTLRWEILDAEGHAHGTAELYPGWGNYATSLWKPGQVVRDTYRIRIGDDMPSPGMGVVALTVLDAASDSPLPATDPQGRFLGLQFRLRPFKMAAGMTIGPTDAGAEYVLGERIALVARQAQANPDDHTISLHLTWQALAPMDKDYIAFIHVVDASGATVWQVDRQPRNGAYPTSLWDVGEIVDDVIAIRLPDDAASRTYRLHMGVYDPDTQERLLAFDPYGRRLKDDIIVLALP